VVDGALGATVLARSPRPPGGASPAAGARAVIQTAASAPSTGAGTFRNGSTRELDQTRTHPAKLRDPKVSAVPFPLPLHRRWYARASVDTSGAALDLLSGLLPPDVATAEGDPRVATAVRPGEATFIARAVEKRRLEFASVRACARVALRSLGGPECDIPVGPGREPLFPDGFVGSLTHTDRFCGAAVARRAEYEGVGIDAEPDVPLEQNIASRVAAGAEIARTAELLRLEPGAAAHLVFSAKEAFYKCQFPVTREFLGFEDVRIEFDAAGLRAVLLRRAARFEAGATFHGRFRHRGGLFLTAFWLPAFA